MSIPAIIQVQRQFFATGVTKEFKFRYTPLQCLEQIVEANDQLAITPLVENLL